MKESEKNIDRLIRQALNDDEDQVYEDLGEQSIFDMAFGVLEGRQRALKILMVIITFIMFIVCVWAIVNVVNAVDTNALIRWLAIAFALGMGVGFLKLYWWLEMEKNALIREMKRIELQIAVLSRKLGH